MFKNKRSWFLFVGLAVLVGFLLGSSVTGFLVAGDNFYSRMTVFTRILHLIEANYVENVDAGTLMDGAIEGMLKKLDPHSTFLSKDHFKHMSEKFSGNFYGIGIYFGVQNEVLTVISPIEGTPAHRVGIRSGDQIIKIDGKSALGIKEDQVQKKLRGPKGTKVVVTIRRQGLDEPIDFTIIRDKIPIRSVTSAFMIDSTSGYIRLAHFSQTTADEVEKALSSLEAQGMKHLLFDLRGNSGGYLDQAVKVADKFISGNKLIVSTKGRIPSSAQEYLSTDQNTHPLYPLIVMINRGSASASEIVAGAVQDWDRGLIVGTTSFGKGLVQSLYSLTDGSALKLTTARYYTPSGRLIQRDYKGRSYEDYIADAGHNVAPLSSSPGTSRDDSGNAQQSPVFTTAAGRRVYGGGGITPDVTIPDNDHISKLMTHLLRRYAFLDFATYYLATHRDQFALELAEFVATFEVSPELVQMFHGWLGEQKVAFQEEDFQADLKVIKLYIKKEIAINLWGDNAGRQVLAQGDRQLQQALTLFPEAEKLLQGKISTN